MKTLPEEYIVECSNAQETTIAANYFKEKHKVTVLDNWTYYKYVYNSKLYPKDLILWANLREDIKHLPIIKFKDWGKLINKTDNMEKEIIGYKLIKREYYDVACKIVNTDLQHPNFNYNIAIAKSTIATLQEAGVLDLWFEPVYEEEFKVGDWCYVVGGGIGALGADGFVGQITTKEKALNLRYNGELTSVNAPVYVSNFYAAWGLCEGYELRKATKSEIKEALLTEAKKRYPEGTAIKSVLSGSIVRVEPHSKIFIDSKGNIDNGCSGYIYANGKWAEIIETTPDITINGYKAEFFDDYVKFGCQEVDVDFINKLYYFQSRLSVDFTKEADKIKTIVEYYENK